MGFPSRHAPARRAAAGHYDWCRRIPDARGRDTREEPCAAVHCAAVYLELTFPLLYFSTSSCAVAHARVRVAPWGSRSTRRRSSIVSTSCHGDTNDTVRPLLSAMRVVVASTSLVLHAIDVNNSGQRRRIPIR